MILSGSHPTAGSISFQQLVRKAESGEFRKLSHNGMVVEAWYTDAARDSIMKDRKDGPMGGGFLQGADLVVEIPPSEKNIDRLDQLAAWHSCARHEAGAAGGCLCAPTARRSRYKP